MEGCFDVAQLVEAGIRNAAATFGPHLDPDQLPRLQEIAAATEVRRFRVFYDRDEAGHSGQAEANGISRALRPTRPRQRPF